jgi:MFS family permease
MAGTSFLSDLGHEAQSTVLPTFMAALGLPPAALGAVEGIADATASFLKLGAGWFSDRLGRLQQSSSAHESVRATSSTR